jgi:hypothetical protein
VKKSTANYFTNEITEVVTHGLKNKILVDRKSQDNTEAAITRH